MSTPLLCLGNVYEDPPTTGVEGSILPLPNLSAWKGMEVHPGIVLGSKPDPTLNDETTSKMSDMPNVNRPELEGIE